VARENLKGVSGVPPTDAPTVMKKRRGSPSKIARRLEQGAFRRTKLLNVDDWISWIYGIIGLALLLGVTSVTPHLYATAKNYVNLIRAGRLLTPDVPQWSNTPVPAIAFVDALPPDANPEFDLISEDRVWDLRPLRPQASARSSRAPR